MSSHLLVERALALVPGSEEFLPLKEAVIGASRPDLQKRWAGSGVYAILGKRVVDPARIAELLPAALERHQRRLSELYTLVARAMEEEHAGDATSAASTLIRAGELEEQQHRLREAEQIYTLALELARNLRDKEPQILALRRLGRVHRAQVRLEQAWSCYEQSHRLAVDQLDDAGQVIACQGLGNVASDRGQREVARTWYQRGLQLARAMERPDLIWPCYSNLAMVAVQHGELTEAEDYLVQAWDTIEQASDKAAIPFWYNNKGILVLERRDGPAAEQVYREALSREVSPFSEVIFRTNLGHALVLQGRLLEAEEQARTAEELAIVHGFIPNLVEVYGLLGAVAEARCDEEGFIFYEQALAVCREQNLPQVKEAGVYHHYGLLFKACGRMAEAVPYLGKAREIYEELGLSKELGEVSAEIADSPTLVPE